MPGSPPRPGSNGVIAKAMAAIMRRHCGSGAQRYDAAAAERRLPQGFVTEVNDLWRYYLMYSEGGFRGGGIDVAQVTLIRR